MNPQKLTLALVFLSLSAAGCGDHEPSLNRASNPHAPSEDPEGGSGSVETTDTVAKGGSSSRIQSGSGSLSPTNQGGQTAFGGTANNQTTSLTVPDPQWVSIETRTPNVVRASDPLSVTCLLRDSKDNLVLVGASEHPTVSVVPEGALTLTSDGQYTAKQAGNVQVTCSLKERGLTDETPSVVQVLPGIPQRTITSLDRNRIIAGEHVEASCQVLDSSSNIIPIDTPHFQSTPSSSNNTFNSKTGTFERSGQYQVSCDVGLAVSEPAKLEVLPAAPANLSIALVPAQTTYAVGSAVELNYQIQDRFGNPVNDAQVTVTSNPTGNQLGATKFSYSKAGTYRITTTVGSPTYDGKPLSKSVDIFVDGNGPTITCDSPRDGAFVDEKPGSTITFRGSAIDESRVVDLNVNGSPVAVDLASHFAVELPTKFGINFVDLVSTDSNGQKTKQTCSFMLADQWLEETKALNDGISFWLRQPAVDDNSRVNLNSLGDFLSRVLSSDQLKENIHESLLVNPILKSGCDQVLFGTCVLSTKITYLDLRVDGPTNTQLALQQDGLGSTTRIENVGIELDISGSIAGIPFNKIGWVRFSSIDVQSILDLSIEGGRPNATVRRGATATQVGAITTEFSGLEGQALAAVVSLANGILREFVAAQVQSYVTEQLGGTLNEIVRTLDLDAFSTVQLVPRLDGTTPIALEFSSQFSSVATTTDALLFGMTSEFHSETSHAKPSNGIPLSAPINAFALPNSGAIGASVHESMLNQALHTLWRAGYFDVNLDKPTKNVALPDGMKVELSTQLPPVSLVLEDRIELSLGGVTAKIVYPPLVNVPVPIRLGAKGTMAVHLLNNSLVFDSFALEELHFAAEATDLDSSTSALVEATIPMVVQYLLTSALAKALPVLPIPSFTLPDSLNRYGLPGGAHFGMVEPNFSSMPPRFIIQGAPGIR
jgi:hypothetical protein